MCKICIWISILWVVLGAQASSETNTLLIEKFQKIHLNLAPSDPTRVSVTLRLADLLSERARLDSARELGEGCVTCRAGSADRKEALKLYKEALPKLAIDQQGKVLAQMGHLHQLLGQEAAAQGLYLEMIQRNPSPELVAEAKISLAEMAFKRRDFPQALLYYNQVLQTSHRRGLASYRRAWCHFNMGEVEKASGELKDLLSNPQLLTRASGELVTVDEQFKGEVAKDYATFLAKKGSTLEDAKSLFQLSPKDQKIENVSFLAAELERLGKAQDSIRVWEFILGQQDRPVDRIENQIHTAQLHWALGDKVKSFSSFNEALSGLQKLGTCADNRCPELTARLRKYILDWHRGEKKTPSPELLDAYLAYLEVFPGEADIQVWAKDVAKDRKNYSVALDLNLQLQEKIAHRKTVQGLPSLKALRLEAVEIAEAEGSEALRRQEYQRFLGAESGESAWPVQYQLAHMDYEKGLYADSLGQFLKVVRGSKDKTLANRAADLAMDAATFIKDPAKIETVGLELATLLPARRKEFTEVAGKAVVNKVVGLSNENLEAAWSEALRVRPQDLDPETRSAYLRNKIIIAEKTQRFPEARSAVEDLLALPNLAAEDIQFALEKKEWLAELALDFKTAFQVHRSLKLPNVSLSARTLKLAMYADLAGEDVRPFYDDYLKSGEDAEKKSVLVEKILEKEKYALPALRKYSQYIKSSEAYSRLALQSYLHQPSEKLRQEILKDPRVTASREGRFLKSFGLRNDCQAMDAGLKASVLKSKTQTQLARSIRERVTLLEKGERALKDSIDAEFWAGQLVGLEVLGRENKRLYEELMGLPIPPELSEAEQQEYMTLLSQQATPYLLKSQQLKAKHDEFLAAGDFVSKYQDSLQKSSPQMEPLLREEVSFLLNHVPEEKKTPLQAVLTWTRPPDAAVGIQEIERLRAEVRANPLHKNSIEELLKLERERKNGAMVSYLEARLQRLDEIRAAGEKK